MHNAIADLLSKSETSSGFGIENNRDPTTLLIRNDTGADLPQFGIVGIGSPLVSPSDNMGAFLNRFAFAGVVPSTTYKTKFAITLEPIATGSCGRCRISGLCHCYIYMASAATPDFAAPTTNVNYLVKADCGVIVLWRSAGLNIQRAIVLL